jgi:hypothetical protein
MESTPDYIDVVLDVVNSPVRVRVSRELAEDELLIEHISADAFRAWVEENIPRIERAALDERVTRPAHAIGEDWTIVLAKWRPRRLLSSTPTPAAVVNGRKTRIRGRGALT